MNPCWDLGVKNGTHVFFCQKPTHLGGTSPYSVSMEVPPRAWTCSNELLKGCKGWIQFRIYSFCGRFWIKGRRRWKGAESLHAIMPALWIQYARYLRAAVGPATETSLWIQNWYDMNSIYWAVTKDLLYSDNKRPVCLLLVASSFLLRPELKCNISQKF